MNISQDKLANDIDVPPRSINEIVHGEPAITADTDARTPFPLPIFIKFKTCSPANTVGKINQFSTI